MTPEGKLKADVKALLATHNAWFFMPVSRGMGRAGISDFVGVHRGTGFVVETKATGKHATKLQQRELDRVAAAGGAAFLIHPETLATLEAWLNRSL